MSFIASPHTAHLEPCPASFIAFSWHSRGTVSCPFFVFHVIYIIEAFEGYVDFSDEESRYF
jgi:hypothetical protein